MVLSRIPHSDGLRRAVAALLAVCMAWPLIGAGEPAGKGGESRLPACCRRDGKHGCGMAAGKRSAPLPSGGSIEAHRGVCPLYPAGRTAPSAGRDLLPAPPAPYKIACAAREIAAPQGRTMLRLSLLHGANRRGPPAAKPA
jgi:hypothetical protein